MELEIFRQLQMRRKQAPRPSDSSDNSAGSAGGLTSLSASFPLSSSGSGPVSTTSAGRAESSAGGPSSSTDPGSDLSTGPKFSTNLAACHGPTGSLLKSRSVEPANSSCHSDAAASVQSLGGQPLVVQSATLGSAASQSTGRARLPDSGGPAGLHHRVSRPVRQLSRAARLPALTADKSADSDSGTDKLSSPLTLSQGVSKSTDTDNGTDKLNSPLTLSQGVSKSNNADSGTDKLNVSTTVSQGVSSSWSDMCSTPVTLSASPQGVGKSADTDSGTNKLNAPLTLSQSVSKSGDTDSGGLSSAVVSVLGRPATLSRDVDSSADLQLETIATSNERQCQVSAPRDTGLSVGENVTPF